MFECYGLSINDYSIGFHGVRLRKSDGSERVQERIETM